MLFALRLQSAKRSYQKIKPDAINIDEVYRNNLLLYYYSNSDYKKNKSKVDSDGFQQNIVNDWINEPQNLEYCQTKDGFKITENDFLDFELERLEYYINEKELLLTEKKQYRFYKNFLLKKLSQQAETKKPDAEKTEMHPEIFKNNKFEVWQSMFDAFNITESNYSTDIDFMFEVMKYNDYIHSHIGLTNIRNWINEKYEISFEKIRYTDPKSNANKKRLAIFNEIISK